MATPLPDLNLNINCADCCKGVFCFVRPGRSVEDQVQVVLDKEKESMELRFPPSLFEKVFKRKKIREETQRAWEGLDEHLRRQGDGLVNSDEVVERCQMDKNSCKKKFPTYAQVKQMMQQAKNLSNEKKMQGLLANEEDVNAQPFKLSLNGPVAERVKISSSSV